MTETAESYDASKYERPSVTVDVVIFSLRDGRLQVLLVQRKHWPYADHWAIPGGFVNMDESLEAAARRELLEETGLCFVSSQGDARRLRFIFRAITPPGRSRRFDARFFLAHASSISGNTDDFGAASDELSHLHWIGVSEARALDLPFITEVVLSEVSHLLRNGDTTDGVPFFDNSGQVPTFRRLG